jgi:KDO2-lipid IV(A) lauroyltransferase
MADSAAKRRKKKKHSPARDLATYLLLRTVVVFLYLAGVENALKVACFLGRVMWKHYHRGRQRAIENLEASFPEKDRDWIERTGRRSFEQVVMLTADILFTPRLVKKYNWRNYSSYRGVERAKWLMQEGGGLLMVTGHYGNFEIMGYLLGLFGFNVYSVARPLDNRFVNDHLYGVRRLAGQKIIDKKGASRMMDKLVLQGATVCFIADQDAGRKGVFVDFFGRKASTYKSIALLAATRNVPIGVGYSRRIGDRFLFEIGVNRIIFPEEWAGRDDPIKWITSEYTAAIEQFVREDPSQYWWLHRRWKHRPRKP